jgi:hypothetical protein
MGTPYRVMFEVVPAAAFGVPQDGVTVIPAEPGQYVGDTFHRSGVRVAYGQLSRFRDDADAIAVSLTLGSCRADLRDNFLFVEVSADSDAEALELARVQADRFVQFLGASGRHWMAAIPRLVESSDHGDTPVNEAFTLSSVTTFDLAALQSRIEEAALAMATTDVRLDRAVAYFQHAMWLFQQRASLGDPFDSNSVMLMSSVVLNLWKAATSIIGDPNAGDRDYQRRYRELGFDDTFFNDRIEPLRRLRNDADVAHYSLNVSLVHKVLQNFGQAVQTVGAIIASAVARPTSTPPAALARQQHHRSGARASETGGISGSFTS